MEEYIKKPEIGSELEKKKGTYITWVKSHKKELIFAGISITSIIGIILGIKNKDSIEALWKALQKSVAQVPADKAIVKVTENTLPVVAAVSTTDMISLPVHREYMAAFDVTEHIRNLHEGWHASPEKIAAAASHNIELLPGQTWVENYIKGAIVA